MKSSAIALIAALIGGGYLLYKKLGAANPFDSLFGGDSGGGGGGGGGDGGGGGGDGGGIGDTSSISPGLADSQKNKIYLDAVIQAVAQGIDLKAPVGGGKTTILYQGANPTPNAQVVSVDLSAQQAATYNSMMAQGYTPFQAATEATSWASNMTNAQIIAAQASAFAAYFGK